MCNVQALAVAKCLESRRGVHLDDDLEHPRDQGALHLENGLLGRHRCIVCGGRGNALRITPNVFKHRPALQLPH